MQQYVHIELDLNVQILSSKKISTGKLQKKNTVHCKYFPPIKNYKDDIYHIPSGYLLKCSHENLCHFWGVRDIPEQVVEDIVVVFRQSIFAPDIGQQSSVHEGQEMNNLVALGPPLAPKSAIFSVTCTSTITFSIYNTSSVFCAFYVLKAVVLCFWH